MKKLCLFCKEFYWQNSEPDWSEVTPGADAEMGCSAGIFHVDFYNDTLEKYRRDILTAENCVHYEQIEVEDDEGID